MAGRYQNDLPGQEAKVLPNETDCQPGTKMTKTADRNTLPNLLIYFSLSAPIFKIFQVAKHQAEVCATKEEPL